MGYFKAERACFTRGRDQDRTRKVCYNSVHMYGRTDLVVNLVMMDGTGRTAIATEMKTSSGVLRCNKFEISQCICSAFGFSGITCTVAVMACNNIGNGAPSRQC
ncbi:hypothetical protein AN958_12094 [Leucoagaricus sp. SymC.cos]|nr:hypothetical protein AN958_12094 [Leucoagaricus sp. SymC.cos]